MARKRSRSKNTRRRTSKSFNVSGLAESALLANAVSMGMFNCGIRDFIMSTSGGVAGGSIVSNATVITARELIAGLTGGDANTQYTITSQGRKTTYGDTLVGTIGENLKANGAGMVGQLIVIPAGFRVFNKLTSKPRATLNKAMKMGGLPLKV